MCPEKFDIEAQLFILGWDGNVLVLNLGLGNLNPNFI